MPIFTQTAARFAIALSTICLLAVVAISIPQSSPVAALLIGQAYTATFQQYQKKPFAILGQKGAIYKRKGQAQQFLILKGMNTMMAGYLFGNLKNKLIVQQLASQVIGKTKKGGKLKVNVTSINTVDSGTMTLPGTSTPGPYEHVRANIVATDPSNPNEPADHKTLDVKVMRSAPQNNTENIVTTYSIDKATNAKTTTQFINSVNWASI